MPNSPSRPPGHSLNPQTPAVISARPEGVPTLGRADTGRTPWESRLIERLRLKHYSWRTEQTYREWAWRLARFVGARGLEKATSEDVKGFLSELAVRGRVSVATQRQALNALVFLFREALERKYPGAGMSWEWHWLFPSRQVGCEFGPAARNGWGDGLAREW
jgi:hypothetical protein